MVRLSQGRREFRCPPCFALLCGSAESGRSRGCNVRSFTSKIVFRGDVSGGRFQAINPSFPLRAPSASGKRQQGRFPNRFSTRHFWWFHIECGMVILEYRWHQAAHRRSWSRPELKGVERVQGRYLCRRRHCQESNMCQAGPGTWLVSLGMQSTYVMQLFDKSISNLS